MGDDELGGLAVVPSVRNVWAESDAATGFHVASGDDEVILVAFTEPPAEGAPLYLGFEARR